MCVVRVLARLALLFSDEGLFWRDGASAAAEPWGFLIAALWIAPKFHRRIALTFVSIYVFLYLGEVVYFSAGIMQLKAR